METERKSVHDENGGETITNFSRRVTVGGLNGLKADYKRICQQDKEKPSTAFEANKNLNRDSDIPCFDETRVALPADGDPNDYIHANYVDGYRQHHKYIVTQGPTADTIMDFWRMVWQEKVLVIVALTKLGGDRCELYFPCETGKASVYGEIKVTNRGVHKIQHIYAAVPLLVSRGDEEPRRIVLFVYYNWPNEGAPKDVAQVLRFIEQVNYNQGKLKEQWGQTGAPPAKHPIIVHGSAGIGRPGTLVALDIICCRLDHTAELNKEKKDKSPTLNLIGTIVRMRAQRAKMVQNETQYCFLPLAAVEYALRMDYLSAKDFDCTAFLNSVRQTNGN